jgi:low affinity Fe/Cu permease
MPGIGDLDHLVKNYGLSVGLLIAVCLVLGLVVVRLYRDNLALHAKLTELLDQRGKFLDSILTEAINGKSNQRSS